MKRNSRIPVGLAVAVACGAAAAGGTACGIINSIRSGRAPTSSDVSEAKKVSKDAVEVGGAIKDAAKELTPENEYFIGRSVATNILAKYDYRYADKGADWAAGAVSDLTRYVNRVGAAVAVMAIAQPESGDRPSPLAGYHFVVLDIDAPNAFASPGGFVLVTKGAVKMTKNEDELACLLAHEVGHVARGHGLKAIKKSRWGGVSKKVISKASTYTAAEISALTDAFGGALDDMVDSLTVSGYAPGMEYEADEYGAELAARVGYDPGALKTYLSRLDEWAKKSGEGFAKTHPPASERLAKVEKRLGKLAKKGYATGDPASRKGRYKSMLLEL